MASVVIVCTDADLGTVMALGCQRSGHTTVTYGDYATGLDAVRATGPALFVVRIMRSEPAGSRVCAAAKADPVARRVPLLVVTADPDIECVEADTVLRLPFGLKDFGRCVDAILGRAPAVSRGELTVSGG